MVDGDLGRLRQRGSNLSVACMFSDKRGTLMMAVVDGGCILLTWFSVEVEGTSLNSKVKGCFPPDEARKIVIRLYVTIILMFLRV
ncbi:hypothetical protein Hdeb2414_s0001g00040701 [Helianthus debilis subsp. tardiflorus]